VINWDSLNTNSSEILQFLKASGNFAVLNRVIQGGATQFDGSLFGNQGHVIIVNPNGIVFGPTALIQAHKFTASALDMANTDFMNGIYNFTGGGVGEVANYGDISADQVALIGRKVLNAGVIRSPGGYVLMAAGDKVFLGQDGSNIVVEVEGVTVPDLAAGIGDVINEGTIEAAGGKIVLAAGDTFSRAIDGLDSMSLAVESGTGRVGQFGILSADGVEGDGGSITMTAGDIVALSSDSVTTANAGTNGDGGQVIVYSPDTALFREGAQIQAKGGSESGDGGFVEVSGKKHVEIHGLVNTTAPQGATGTFLIDPYDIVIDDFTTQNGDWSLTDPDYWTSDDSADSQLNVADLLTNLGATDVVVQTGGDSGIFIIDWFDDDITVNHAIDYSGETYNDLTLDAHDNININAAITTGAHDLTLVAGDDVLLNDPISLTSGNLMVSGDNFVSDSSGSITASAGGDVTLNMNGYITTNAPIDFGFFGGGHLEMLGGQNSGTDDININANITAGSMRIKNGNDTSGEQSESGIYVADGVTLFGTVGDVVIEAVHDIDLGTGLVTAIGDIFLNADEDGYGDPKGDPGDYYPNHYGGGDLHAKGTIIAMGDIDILGNDILLEATAPVAAYGDLTITGSTSVDSSTGWGDVHAQSILDAITGTIEISGDDDTIILDDDVTAGVDLLLNNNTEVAADKTLKAGQNVTLAPLKTVTAQGNLTIEATGGAITARDIIMAANGSTLDLTQNDTIDMEFGTVQK